MMTIRTHMAGEAHNADGTHGGDRLSIIIVNDFAHVYGGASSVALASARELARRGHRVVLFSAIGPVDPQLETSGVRVLCLQQKTVTESSSRLKAALQAAWNQRAAEEMRHLLSGLDRTRTLVHLHGWTRGLSPSIVPVLTGSKFSLVATIHDYFLACPNGGFYNYASQSICTLRPLSGSCLASNCGPGGRGDKAWRVFRQELQKTLGKLPDSLRHVICISPLSRSVIEPFLAKGCTIHKISNPIDVPKSPPTQVALNRHFLAVGRLSEAKGPILAAEAARRAQARLIFVGDGELRKRIENEYPETEVTGWLPQSEVREYLARARALIFASQWYETQGLAVLEAAAMGVPAAVADSCAARDAVLDGETGLHFRSGDVQSLAHRMRDMQEDSLLETLGRNAYQRFWESPPTLSTHVDQLEACYRRVIQDY